MWDAAGRLADQHQELVDQFKPSLHQFLKRAEDHSQFANGNAIAVAVDWQLTEASIAIEKAYSNDQVDCGVCGDWEVVSRSLGIEGEGLPMPVNPFNEMDDFRRDAGVGCFSRRPIFGDGEINDAVAAAYYELASQRFSESSEAKALPSDSPSWAVTTFLEMGITYLGVTVDTMSLRDVQEILVDLYPRKVSMEADDCPKVSRRLAAFWNFVAREQDVENAEEIAAEIESGHDKFVDAMTDPSNFGMAKGIMMAGVEGGFDMTSEQGIAEFMSAYNSRLSVRDGEPMDEYEKVTAPSFHRYDAPVEHVPSLVDGKTRKQRKKLLASKTKKAKKR